MLALIRVKTPLSTKPRLASIKTLSLLVGIRSMSWVSLYIKAYSAVVRISAASCKGYISTVMLSWLSFTL